jgi:hypothetical protein
MLDSTALCRLESSQDHLRVDANSPRHDGFDGLLLVLDEVDLLGRVLREELFDRLAQARGARNARSRTVARFSLRS